MAKGTGKPGKDARPAAEFEKMIRQTRLTTASQPGAPKRYPSDGTDLEKFLYKRERWVELFPARFRELDYRFQLLIKLANDETYKFSSKETALIVARLNAWTKAVEQSFERHRVLSPVDLPAFTPESTEAVIMELWPELLTANPPAPSPKGDDVWTPDDIVWGEDIDSNPK